MVVINNVIVIGRLTADPELRFLQGSGIGVTNFNLAIDKKLSKDKKKEFEQQGKLTADFPRITVWGKQAESSAKYLKKGLLVAVQGRIETSSYDNSDGKKIYQTGITAENVQFLEWGDKDSQNTSQDTGNNDGGFQPVDDDEIPF